MSNEELMRPRYKVINTWPDMADRKYVQGQIITLDKIDEKTTKGQSYIITNESKLYDAFFEMFPHLFKKLEWWEERKPEEMPEYLKCLSPDFCFKKGDIIRVSKWLLSFGPTLRFYSSHTDKITLHPHLYQPATAAEYEQYINQKEKQ